MVRNVTLLWAVEEVKKKGDGYKQQGLSPFSFFVGVLNVFAAGFIIGKWPEHYWIFVLIKCYGCLGFVWHWRLTEWVRILYMTEFCWVIVHVMGGFLTMVGLAALGCIDSTWVYSHTALALKIYWGIANGPLAFAALSLMNSLVFHNKQQLASCFIHLTPCSLTWTLRWYADKINAAYPDVIQIDEDLDNQTTFKEIALSAICVYMIW